MQIPRIRRHKKGKSRQDRLYVTFHGVRYYLGVPSDPRVIDKFNAAVEKAENPPLNVTDDELAELDHMLAELEAEEDPEEGRTDHG